MIESPLYKQTCRYLLEGNARVFTILLGPPGSGKGTHAPALGKSLGVPHISTGDLFRAHIRNETWTGKRIKELMDRGELVPDEIVLEMLFERLSQEDCEKGAILDGFPRTVEQAKSLEEKLKQDRCLVLHLKIDPELLVERICGRVVCMPCGEPYHIKYNPPQEKTLCDKCQGTLHQRRDDTEEVLKKRLDVYRHQTEPLIEYYQAINALYEIDGNQKKEDVFSEMIRSLKFV